MIYKNLILTYEYILEHLERNSSSNGYEQKNKDLFSDSKHQLEYFLWVQYAVSGDSVTPSIIQLFLGDE